MADLKRLVISKGGGHNKGANARVYVSDRDQRGSD